MSTWPVYHFLNLNAHATDPLEEVVVVVVILEGKKSVVNNVQHSLLGIGKACDAIG